MEGPYDHLTPEVEVENRRTFCNTAPSRAAVM